VDYFRRIDVSTLPTTYAPAATCLFGSDIEAQDTPTQDVLNEGQGTPADIAVSFDGVTDHARLIAGTAAAGRSWFLHPRGRVWLRRLAGAGAGQFVQVAAWT
jgi:hypothetical protein